ncbi:MAG: PGRS family protein [Polyangiaceae bacterium]|nr:PGRS family protein [Polyangiaceae bacterium]
MRAKRSVPGVIGVLVTGAAVHVGCSSYYEDLYEPLTEPLPPGTGGGGGTPAGCVPSENASPVGNECGVFVSSSLGDDANDGTKEKPVRTIGAGLAMAAASGKALYACAEMFDESVSVEAGVDVFGGLDCANGWAWIGETTKTALTAAAGEIPLSFTSSASGARMTDFSIEAVDAVADGGSSIAVVVDGASASFVRCDVVAGNGQAGKKGETPADPVGPTDSDDAAIRGNDGKAACDATASQLGGDPKENEICPPATGGPLGGLGGAGLINNGSSGDAQPANAQTALGGSGEPAADPTWDCATGVGLGGSNGVAGDGGVGATGDASLGSISAAGYSGIDGQPGGPGAPGQGGGGGGGAKGKPGCAGASGGGGGAGGCGGKGGFGGQAGGASIGIISLGATLSFEAVTIRTGRGGDGGEGGDGQGGGVGGNGGNGGAGDGTAPTTWPACNGGAGGHGGSGGKGGGGRGGHAIGIAYVGAAPSQEGVTIEPGDPGLGGVGADAQHSGADGVKAYVQELP